MINLSELRVGTVLTNGVLPEPYVVVSMTSTQICAAHFAFVAGEEFKDWIVVVGAGVGRAPVPMTPNHLRSLQQGDRLRHKDSAQTMIVVRKEGGEWGYRLVLCRTCEVTDPEEWNVVVP